MLQRSPGSGRAPRLSRPRRGASAPRRGTGPGTAEPACSGRDRSGSAARIRSASARARTGKVPVADQVGDPEARQAVLGRPEELPGAAQAQILLGHAGSRRHGAPGRAAAPCAGPFADAMRKRCDSPPPRPIRPAQLVELREPEAVGMLDDHDGGPRNVDAHLDHGGGDEAGGRRRRGIAARRGPSPVPSSGRAAGRSRSRRRPDGGPAPRPRWWHRAGRPAPTPPPADGRRRPAPPRAASPAIQRSIGAAPPVVDEPRDRRHASRRHLAQQREVQIAVERERERARNRRGAHDEAVRADLPGAASRSPLSRSRCRWSTPKRCCSSTTTRPRRGELHPFAQDGMRAGRAPRSRPPPAPRGGAAAPPPACARAGARSSRRAARTTPRRAAPAARRGSRWGPGRPTATPASAAARQRQRRHHRLARADIALQQPVHRGRAERGRRGSRPGPVPARR